MLIPYNMTGTNSGIILEGNLNSYNRGILYSTIYKTIYEIVDAKKKKKI